MSEIDDNGDNQIDFNEFKRMLSMLSEQQERHKKK
jgi:Ca2+-binding EF-hand superfamily protein